MPFGWMNAPHSAIKTDPGQVAKIPHFFFYFIVGRQVFMFEQNKQEAVWGGAAVVGTVSICFSFKWFISSSPQQLNDRTDMDCLSVDQCRILCAIRTQFLDHLTVSYRFIVGFSAAVLISSPQLPLDRWIICVNYSSGHSRGKLPSSTIHFSQFKAKIAAGQQKIWTNLNQFSMLSQTSLLEGAYLQKGYRHIIISQWVGQSLMRGAGDKRGRRDKTRDLKHQTTFYRFMINILANENSRQKMRRRS